MATIAEIESMLDYWRGMVILAKREKRKKHAAERVRELEKELLEAKKVSAKVAPAPFPEMNPKQP